MTLSLKRRLVVPSLMLVRPIVSEEFKIDIETELRFIVWTS